MSIDRIILRASRAAVRVFYRVTVQGEPVPAHGPLVLVGNHPNGLVDPVLISCATTRSLRFLGKAPLFRMPVLGALVRGARVLPVYRAQDGANTKADNEQTFSAVFEALIDGDAIALFPEGKSHSEPKLQRMKTGAARMALGASARGNFELGLRVVPVGLVYRARRRFRSSAILWVGASIDVSDLKEVHASDPWQAVEQLTERIGAGLADLTLELEHWEELPLLEFVADLQAAPRTANFEAVRTLAHELASARDEFPQEVIDLAERARRLKRRLALFGARPSDLSLTYSWMSVLRYVLRQLAFAVVVLPLYLLGLLVWFLPWQTARLIVGQAKPSVDVWATTVVLSGMVLFPLWLVAVGATATWSSGWAFGIGAALLTLGTGLVALLGNGFLSGLARDVRLFLRAKSRGTLLAHLRDECDDLVREIETMRTRVS